MPSKAVIADHPNTLFKQLIADLRHLKSATPFKRIAVVVPNRPLARWVQSNITAALNGNAILGVEVVTLYGLAARTNTGAPPTPVSSEIHRLLLTEQDPPAWLEDIRDPDGLLLATFRDLYDAGMEAPHVDVARESLQHFPWWERGESLLQSFVLWRETAETLDIVDHTTVTREATEQVLRGQLPDFDHYLWYGIYDLTGAMADFVQAMCRTTEGSLYFPGFDPTAAYTEQVSSADEYLKQVFDATIQPAMESVQRIDHTLDAGQSNSPPVPSVFDASGERAELTEVARRISAWACQFEGSPPWHDVAVIARELSPYRTICHEVFDRFEIPLCVYRPEPAQNSGTVRSLKALVSLVRDGLRRDQLLNVLRAAPTAHLPIAARLGALDHVLKKRGVVGPHDWQHVMHTGALRPLEPSDETTAQTLVCTLQEILKAWPEKATVQTHLSFWQQLLSTIFGPDEEPPQSHSALEAMPGSVQTSQKAFLSSLSRVIAQPLESEDNVGGVYLLDIMEARMMSFSHVFVIGLNRRQWPRVVRQDPLMPDLVRQTLSRDVGLFALPIKDRGHAEEALLFRLACNAACHQLTLSYCRSNEDGAAQVKSPFVDGVCRTAGIKEHLSVPRRRKDQLWRPIEQGLHAAIPIDDLAYWASVTQKKTPQNVLLSLSQSEFSSRLLRAALKMLETRDTLKGEPNEFEGVLGKLPTAYANRALAPTSVETLFECPWKFYVSKVLEVAPELRVEELPELDPATFGSLIHTIHDTIIKQLTSGQPATWSSLREAAEHRVQEELKSPLEQQLLVPRVMARVDGLIAVLRERYDSGEYRPVLSEKEFTGTVMLDGNRPVTISARIDRLDQGSGGLEAVDLKTGSNPPAHTNALLNKLKKGGGLQTAFYHWLKSSEGLNWSGYEYVMEGGENHRVGLTGAEWKQLEEPLRELLESATALLNHGTFVFRKHKRNCTYCKFSTTCLRHSYPSSYRLEVLAENTGQTDTAAAIGRFLRIVNKGVEL